MNDQGRSPLAAVELRRVTRTFPGSPVVHALRDVTLVIHPGEYVSIVGPSGSGKSTLLNILGCLDRPTSGSYLFNGIDVASLKDSNRAALRSSSIGFVFQSFHLIETRTSLENAALGMLYGRTSRQRRSAAAAEALKQVGLASRATFLPSKMSGGERQRVAIARAIAPRPSLLLCDEPTGNLDSNTSTELLDLFDELRASGLTLIVITHDHQVSERAQRQVAIVDGRLEEA